MQAFVSPITIPLGPKTQIAVDRGQITELIAILGAGARVLVNHHDHHDIRRTKFPRNIRPGVEISA